MEIIHPNKTFVADFVHESNQFGNSKHTIIIAAKDKETALNHLQEKIGIKPELTWLMNCDHTVINDQKGRPLEMQAKILFSTYTNL